ncbi:hypothetical protein IQ238_14980 [Pleurocapsales cyanobacterium LEGE 06147]|nr:hypothetical protein [Pleurocapsales cyanobacterium LEGE 06147]
MRSPLRIGGWKIRIDEPTHIQVIAKFIERELEREINCLNLPWLCIREGGIRTGWRKSTFSELSLTVEQILASGNK